MTNDTDHADAVAIVVALSRILIRAYARDRQEHEMLSDTEGEIMISLCDALGMDAEGVTLEGVELASAMERLQ